MLVIGFHLDILGDAFTHCEFTGCCISRGQNSLKKKKANGSPHTLKNCILQFGNRNRSAWTKAVQYGEKSND